MEPITEICYACDQPATTVEHCPPKCFFPEGQRQNLMTVPSCERHNNDNSRDVEYVRNVLTTSWGVNDTGLELFESKTKKSLDRSPKLLTQTFSTMQTVIYDQRVTGMHKYDLGRFEAVLEACVRGIHYYSTRQKHSDWGIVMPSLRFAPSVPDDTRQNWMRLLEMIQTISFARQAAANPSVFQYGDTQLQGNYVYCLFFYEGFIVYALQLAKEPAALLCDEPLAVTG